MSSFIILGPARTDRLGVVCSLEFASLNAQLEGPQEQQLAVFPNISPCSMTGGSYGRCKFKPAGGRLCVQGRSTKLQDQCGLNAYTSDRQPSNCVTCLLCTRTCIKAASHTRMRTTSCCNMTRSQPELLGQRQQQGGRSHSNRHNTCLRVSPQAQSNGWAA